MLTTHFFRLVAIKLHKRCEQYKLHVLVHSSIVSQVPIETTILQFHIILQNFQLNKCVDPVPCRLTPCFESLLRRGCCLKQKFHPCDWSHVLIGVHGRLWTETHRPSIVPICHSLSRIGANGQFTYSFTYKKKRFKETEFPRMEFPPTSR